MAIIESTNSRGGGQIATNSGNISINEATGELLIRKGVQMVTRINSDGFTYYDPDGLARIRIGLNPKDGEVGLWISNEGIDVLEELNGES